MLVQVEQASRRDDIEDYFGSLDYVQIEARKRANRTEEVYVVETDSVDAVLDDLDYGSFVVSEPQRYHHDNADWVVKIYNNYIE